MGIETEIIRKDKGMMRSIVWMKGIGLTTIPAAAVLQGGVENPTLRLALAAYIAGFSALLGYIDRTLARWSDQKSTPVNQTNPTALTQLG